MKGNETLELLERLTNGYLTELVYKINNNIKLTIPEQANVIQTARIYGLEFDVINNWFGSTINDEDETFRKLLYNTDSSGIELLEAAKKMLLKYDRINNELKGVTNKIPTVGFIEGFCYDSGLCGEKLRTRIEGSNFEEMDLIEIIYLSTVINEILNMVDQK